MQFPLSQERILIGRDSDCDVPLDDPIISRHHFELEWDGSTYQLTDHSRNGTFVDGERVTNTLALQHGQQIMAGDFCFEFRESTPTAHETTVSTEYKPTLVLKYEPKSKALTLERIKLDVELPGGKRSSHLLEHLPISIGAVVQNSVAIPDDPYVSRHHCRIEATRGGLQLRDGDSRNGTWWAGHKIQSKLLPERGSFQIGKTTINYHVQVVSETVEPAAQQRCGELLGTSRAMQEIFALVARVAPSDATILITGESGTGKELLARALHAGSGRATRAFVALNCGAIPATIIESELFGHERGAFTGATSQHKGVFEQPMGGTLFLDEIGEMPLDLQTRLLRVLETKTIRRLGGTADVPVDCRIVAATNRNLAELVARGKFREDLFYRLYIVPMNIPPLRERKEDIALLAKHFLQLLSPRGMRLHFTPEAREALLRHRWPGNGRELRHTIERAIMSAHDPHIDAADLRFAPHPTMNAETMPAIHVEKRHDLNDHEREAIETALHAHTGNVTRAAKTLGIARSTLSAKVKKWSIDLDRYRKAN